MKTVTEKEIISDLIHNVYCRIKRSTLHGVGVFAIRPIPKGVDPFNTIVGEPEGQVMINKDLILNHPDIPESVKSMVKDFYAIEKNQIVFPPFGLNELNISYFMNHTDVNPNVVEGPNGNPFITTREIQAGEELLTNYHTFSEETINL